MKSVLSAGFLQAFSSPSLWQSALSTISTVSEASDPSSWSRVWSDEFDNETIDAQKWTILEGDGCDSYFGCGWGQEQVEVASKDNAYISADGNLVIVARYITQEDQSSSKHQSYDGRMITSARLSTYGSADFLHGRVEVRAKVAPGGWGGWSGIWLLPSEDRGLPRASCARVNVMEITKDIENSATASLWFGRKDSGCVSSYNWPHEAGGCGLSPASNVALSDDFHVFCLEWDENEFRWFLDGLHFCTKTMWFAGEPDAAYPAPFDKTFHVEIGLVVGGWGQSAESGATAVDTSAMPKEMIVDYVRISQGPSGSWWTPPESFSASTSTVNQISTSLWTMPVFVFDTLAVAACVLGPFMAMTGLSHLCFNTLLMGMEIGAFKAANALYFVSGSFTVAFIAGVLFGILAGYLAVKHRAMARWNTVGALTVPTLFLLIDVGMISEIGSRYACWAIFGVLTVTFAVLAFPTEYHENAFGVASAAAGSCVLKLGLGRLMGAPGEIFKILDDPLGDRCQDSRICCALGWVSVAMFVIGLVSQWLLARRLQTSTPSILAYSDDDAGNGCETLITIRARTNGANIVHLNGCEKSQGAAKKLNQGSIDESTFRTKTHDKFAWGNAFFRPQSILGSLFRHFPNYQRTPGGVDGCDTGNDSPTPVPIPLTGVHSNKMVSNKGDTIELVVHSPETFAQQHEQRARHSFPWQWSAEDKGVDEEGRQRELVPAQQRRPVARSSVVNNVEKGEGISTTRLQRGVRMGEQQLSDARYDFVDRGEPSGGVWAEAFNEKWGSWLGDRPLGEKNDTTAIGQGQRPPSTEGGGEANDEKIDETARHSARDFDHEALMLSPFDPRRTSMSPAGSQVVVENVPLSSGSSSSSTPLAGQDEELVGSITSMDYGTTVVSAASTIAWKEASPPRDCYGIAHSLPRQFPGKASKSNAVPEKRGRDVVTRSNAVTLEGTGLAPTRSSTSVQNRK